MRSVNKLNRLFLTGFGITFLAALFTGVGIYFILFLLGMLPLSRNALIFLTVLIYALAFAIIKAGMRLKIDLNPFAGPRDEDFPDEAPPSFRRRPYIFKVLAVIWLITGTCSVIWLTPAFAIFWFSLSYPDKTIMLCSFIFSIFAAIIFYFIKDNIIVSIKERFIFFTGGCLGSLAAICVSYYLMGNKIWNLAI